MHTYMSCTKHMLSMHVGQEIHGVLFCCCIDAAVTVLSIKKPTGSNSKFISTSPQPPLNQVRAPIALEFTQKHN